MKDIVQWSKKITKQSHAILEPTQKVSAFYDQCALRSDIESGKLAQSYLGQTVEKSQGLSGKISPEGGFSEGKPEAWRQGERPGENWPDNPV